MNTDGTQTPDYHLFKISANVMASRKDSTKDISSKPDENEYPSGFPQSICDQTPHEKYLCSNCNSVLNKARQTACGHRYCLACVSWLVRNNKTPVCKKCKEESVHTEADTSVLTLDNSFSDAAITKEIQELKVHCANQGCLWRGVLRDFEEHQSQCDYALIPCNLGCGHMVLRRALASHLDKGCPRNTSTCPACAQTLPPAEFLVHHCHQESDLTHADKRHQDGKTAHGRDKVSCIFSGVDCTFKGTAEAVQAHERSSLVCHLQLLLKAVQSPAPSPPLGPAEGGGSLVSALEADGRGGPVGQEASVGQQLQQLQERLRVFQNIVAVLNREVESVQLSVAAMQLHRKSSQDTLSYLEARMVEQQERLLVKESLISALQGRVSALQDVSYDGTFLWRIHDINSKLQEAATGQRSSLFSPAFYTSRYGFKVCLRVYLHGDGVGKGTHISLFFVIMRGEYDALLTWPFRHKVTFFLIDQNQREHVLDAFRPDLTSASFQRPVSDMNVASGCPCFCPLGKLASPKHAYCKGNTLFIKCVVDTSS